MKTVVISFYKAFPPTFGSASVTYNLTKYLPGEKYLIQLKNNEKNLNTEGNISLVNIKCNMNNNFTKFINLALQFPHITSKIKKLCPEIIILEGAAWVLYYLILFYFLKFNKIKSEIVYHGHCVEYLLRKKKNNIFISIITKLAENMLLRKANFATAASEIDAVHFERIYGIIPYILPNGVDVGKFNRVTNEEIGIIKKKYNINTKTILFMGLPSFKPNREAIDFLDKSIMPKLLKKYPNLRLAIIGGKVDFKRKWLINPGNIPFEEVPPFIKATDICLSPIFSGSGTRLKILEYLSAEKPVISTQKGAEGLGLKEGKHFLRAETAEEFINAIIKLIDKDSLRSSLGIEGRDFIFKKYAWDKVMKNFIKELMDKKSRSEKKVTYNSTL